MNILVCISIVPDTTSKINFTDSNKKFDKNGITFIAEIGMNHNGNFDLCFELIKQAKFSGANIVKFQLGWRDKPGEINCINSKVINQLISWAEYFEIEANKQTKNYKQDIKKLKRDLRELQAVLSKLDRS